MAYEVIIFYIAVDLTIFALTYASIWDRAHAPLGIP